MSCKGWLKQGGLRWVTVIVVLHKYKLQYIKHGISTIDDSMTYYSIRIEKEVIKKKKCTIKCTRQFLTIFILEYEICVNKISSIVHCATTTTATNPVLPWVSFCCRANFTDDIENVHSC